MSGGKELIRSALAVWMRAPSRSAAATLACHSVANDSRRQRQEDQGRRREARLALRADLPEAKAFCARLRHLVVRNGVIVRAFTHVSGPL